MMKVEAVIKPEKIGDVKAALAKMGVNEMSLLEVGDLGRYAPKKGCYRGAELVIPFSQRVRLEFVVEEDKLRTAVNAITTVADTGSDSDGKILVSHIESLIRIHNGSQVSTVC